MFYFFHVLINGTFISVSNRSMIKLGTEIELFMLKCVQNMLITRMQLFKMSSVICVCLCVLSVTILHIQCMKGKKLQLQIIERKDGKS